MCRDVAKRAYTEHPSYVDKGAVAQDMPEGRHRQRQPKNQERPEARTMNQFIERTRAVCDFARLNKGLDERRQQRANVPTRSADRRPRRSLQSCQDAFIER